MEIKRSKCKNCIVVIIDDEEVIDLVHKDVPNSMLTVVFVINPRIKSLTCG